MFHDEWYTDVPGVNIALPVEITLNLIDAVVCCKVVLWSAEQAIHIELCV